MSGSVVVTMVALVLELKLSNHIATGLKLLGRASLNPPSLHFCSHTLYRMKMSLNQHILFFL